MQKPVAAAALVLAIFVASDAFAQRIPSSAMPGRERQQLDWAQPGITPRIQLQDGRPAPVIQRSKDKRPAKRRKCRSGSSKRC